MKIGFKVQTKINKPVSEVFSAVVKPAHLNRYFTMTSSGDLKPGATIRWTFTDMPGGLDVKVQTVLTNERIEMTWNSIAGVDTNVVLNFKQLDKNSTLLQIEESGWQNDQKNLDASYNHCQGWEEMMKCLKAYLEFGIDLRNSTPIQNSEGFLRMYSPIVPVTDLKASGAWYQENLGFKVIFTEPELTAFDVGSGSSCFSITQGKEIQSLDELTRKKFEMCFEVKDVKSLHDKLSQREVKVSKIVTQLDRYQVFEFSDLDGNRLSVFQDTTGVFKAAVRSPT